MNCWQCGAAEAALFCKQCQALQPPNPNDDHFKRLGLQARFAYSEEEIVTAHRALQRRVHPDRFVGRGPLQRRLSLSHAAALNDALATLREPSRRAEYLLKLRGRPLDDARDPIQLDPCFLMEIIELREALGELKDADAHVERGRIALEVAERVEGLLKQLGEGLDGDRPLNILAQYAAQLRYLRRILEELEGLQLGEG
ncbi:Fe-S protein assembly co-chaperone HscB [Myxococcota bacterium]|nr:Fe-S protein assembly co-chaperone HscB [Myxococcota bacterium]MBU1429171.1 Fe-S protein assembly co-chaperone HscB [Myxococcota bacterium]MBU1896369.1 Fe-S protein assembly co-chaperone HscB [Myxococcota bacterium]